MSSTSICELGDDRRTRVCVDVGGYYPSSFGRQSGHDRSAEPSRRARDQDDASGQALLATPCGRAEPDIVSIVNSLVEELNSPQVEQHGGPTVLGQVLFGGCSSWGGSDDTRRWVEDRLLTR